MSRTPGRPSERPSDEPELRVDQMYTMDVGRQLAELAQRLAAAATHTNSPELRKRVREVAEIQDDELDAELEDDMTEGLRRTLTAMHEFRKSYDYWERVIAEFSLKRGMTQRQVAGLLGVSTATINRWAQHPVTVTDKD